MADLSTALEGFPFGEDEAFLMGLLREISADADRLGIQASVDYWFYAFLRRFSRFGYFTFGPVTIDVRLIGEIAERTAERRTSGPNVMGDDFVRFSRILVDETARSGTSRVDELHMLLAFMRYGEGLPGRVFGELGVTPDQVEQYVRLVGQAQTREEKLYSPEEAAEYLGVHVQTVRAWIRSGRLRASRLAGQRALRIAASDLLSLLEPVDPGEVV
ncbi:MAG: helix-turn-helix domain-containing protein [Tepidiformaceae bacterium]